MGLFGSAEKDAKKAAENAALHEVRDRLAALPLVDLADEVLRTTFAGSGPGAADGLVAREQILQPFDPTESIFGIDDRAKAELEQIVLEGVQILEHACLVRWDVTGNDHVSRTLYLTRVGRQALADGTVRTLLGA